MLIQILVISGSALVVLGILLSALGRVNVRALVFVGVCAAVAGAVIANL